MVLHLIEVSQPDIRKPRLGAVGRYEGFPQEEGFGFEEAGRASARGGAG